MTAAIAAIEAVAVALATLLIITAIAFLVWWLSFDLGSEPAEVFAAAGSTWLLAHFVPLSFDISPETMQLLGFAPEALSFTLSLVPLGLTAMTVAFAARSGWRFGGRGGSGAAGVLGGTLGFGAAAFGVQTFSMDSAFPLALTLVIPALVYGITSMLSFVLRAVREQHEWWLRVVEYCEKGLARLRVPRPVVVTRRIADALRLATMLLAGYVALAAVGVAIAVIAGYTGVIAASQSLQLDVWGAMMMFVLQLALLPSLIVWSGAWFTGAGFTLGLGSSASPFGALLGPLPGLPLLAAIPEGWGSFAALAPVLLVFVGVLGGTALGNVARRLSLPALLGVIFFATVLAGLGVAALNALASGSFGPGRLAVVGPEVWIVAGFAAAELGIGCLLGAFAARADLARKAAEAPAIALRKFGGADEPLVALAAEVPAAPEGYVAPVASDANVIELPVTMMHDPDEHLTEPLEYYDLPEAMGAPEAPERPIRDPELFDFQETEAIDPLPDSPHDTQHAAASEREGESLSATDPNPEDLVEAYSWDSLPEEQPGTSGEKSKPLWRWPGRKG